MISIFIYLHIVGTPDSSDRLVSCLPDVLLFSFWLDAVLVHKKTIQKKNYRLIFLVYNMNEGQYISLSMKLTVDIGYTLSVHIRWSEKWHKFYQFVHIGED